MSKEVATTDPNRAKIPAGGWSDFVGAGTEEIETSDLTVPFLKMMQGLSPEIQPSDEKYVDGARLGDILLSSTNMLFNGQEGITVIPCQFQKRYIEWTPRDLGGGGPFGNHEKGSVVYRSAVWKGKKLELANGNILEETFLFYVLIVAADKLRPALMSMKVTQLRPGRLWLGYIKDQIMEVDGKTKPQPIFFNQYHLSTFATPGKKGDYYNWHVGKPEPVVDPEQLHAAKEFFLSLKRGDVTPEGGNGDVKDRPEAGFTDVASTPTTEGDDTPF